MEKSKTHIIVEIIQCIPNAVAGKIIVKKTTENIAPSSFDAGEELGEQSFPFDTYSQFIHGKAQIQVDKNLFELKLGEGIMIPAHERQPFVEDEQFKMLCTTIKSGYEQ